jgi:hypothetical protein
MFWRKKSEDKPKIPEHLSKSDLEFFSTWLMTGRMLKEKEQLFCVQKLELTFYSVTVLDVVSEESL